MMRLIDTSPLKEQITLLILEGLSVQMAEHIMELIDMQPTICEMERGCDSDGMRHENDIE